MKRTSRLAAGLVATAALAAPSTLAAAEAAPPVKPVKTQTKQLLKDIAGKDARLSRLVTSAAVTRLADETELALVTKVEEARASLAEVKIAAEAADSTVDTRAVRKELRSFRVENFRIVVTVLAKVDSLEEAAAADTEALAHLAAAEAAALEITATSTKAEVRAARAHLTAAHGELDVEAETA